MEYRTHSTSTRRLNKVLVLKLSRFFLYEILPQSIYDKLYPLIYWQKEPVTSAELNTFNNIEFSSRVPWLKLQRSLLKWHTYWQPVRTQRGIGECIDHESSFVLVIDMDVLISNSVLIIMKFISSGLDGKSHQYIYMYRFKGVFRAPTLVKDLSDRHNFV